MGPHGTSDVENELPVGYDQRARRVPRRNIPAEVLKEASMSTLAPRAAHAVLALVTVAVAGCARVEPYLSDTPADGAVRAALETWASPGGAFLDGVAGDDTVAAVDPTAARAWEVAVLPQAGGAPRSWSLEIPRAEVYPVFGGDAFVAWLEERARALGFQAPLPADVATEVRRGDIRAVADLEVHYGRADGSARRTVERVAYLVPLPGDATEWRIQPESGSAGTLVGALKFVADDLVHRDRDVLDCMGRRSAAGVGRATQLRCLSDVLDRRFGSR